MKTFWFLLNFGLVGWCLFDFINRPNWYDGLMVVIFTVMGIYRIILEKNEELEEELEEDVL